MSHSTSQRPSDGAPLAGAWELLVGGEMGRALTAAVRVLDRHRSVDGELLREIEQFADVVRARGSRYECLRAEGLAARARSMSSRTAVRRAVLLKESRAVGVDPAGAEALIERLRGEGHTTVRMGRADFVMKAQAVGIDEEVATALYERLRTLSRATRVAPRERVPVAARVAFWVTASLLAFPFYVLLPVGSVFTGNDSYWTGFFAGWVLAKYYWVFLIAEGVALLAGIYGLVQSIRLHSSMGVKASLSPLVPVLIVALLLLGLWAGMH